jgi:hypothetical protein
VVAGAGGGQPTERLRRTVASVVGVAARRAGQGAAGAGAGAAAVKFGQTRFCRELLHRFHFCREPLPIDLDR